MGGLSHFLKGFITRWRSQPLKGSRFTIPKRAPAELPGSYRLSPFWSLDSHLWDLIQCFNFIFSLLQDGYIMTGPPKQGVVLLWFNKLDLALRGLKGTFLVPLECFFSPFRWGFCWADWVAALIRFANKTQFLQHNCSKDADTWFRSLQVSLGPWIYPPPSNSGKWKVV